MDDFSLPNSDTSGALSKDVLDRVAALGVNVDCLDVFADTDSLFSKVNPSFYDMSRLSFSLVAQLEYLPPPLPHLFYAIRVSNLFMSLHPKSFM